MDIEVPARRLEPSGPRFAIRNFCMASGEVEKKIATIKRKYMAVSRKVKPGSGKLACASTRPFSLSPRLRVLSLQVSEPAHD